MFGLVRFYHWLDMSYKEVGMLLALLLSKLRLRFAVLLAGFMNLLGRDFLKWLMLWK